MMTRFEALTQRLGHEFNEPGLLLNALRHASYVNEQNGPTLEDNERLEFLGDAVLDLAISHLLMDLFPGAHEGDLSKFRATVVDEAALYEVAKMLALGDHLFLGKGEEQSGGRQKPSLLANAFEAVMGALYLDAGFERTKEIIGRLFSPLLERIGTKNRVNDYKSILQEYTQQDHRALPKYHLVEESGPPHDKTFRIVVTLNGKVLAEETGKSKKEAEQRAAREAFLCIKAEK